MPSGIYVRTAKMMKRKKAREMATKTRNGTLSSSPRLIAKQKASKIVNRTTQAEVYAKQGNEITVKQKITRMVNGTAFDNPEIAAKQKATKITNGTTSAEVYAKQGSEIIAKALATKIANGTTMAEMHAKRGGEIIEKQLASKILNETSGGNFNEFASAFFEYFDKRLNTKGKYGLLEKWAYDSTNKKWYRPDYFNKEIKLIIEYDEEHHYRNNKLSKKDKIKQKVIQERYSSFAFIRIREHDYFLKKKYLKDITEKDYEVFNKIIEDILVKIP